MQSVLPKLGQDSILLLEKLKNTHFATFMHSLNVSYYSSLIAVELKLNKEEQQLLSYAALCHDLGKLVIGSYLLDKSQPLTLAEREFLLKHPLYSVEILEQYDISQEVINSVLHHHERWDGTGYPDRLQGNDIPLFSRIIAVADAFDAMVSHRSYQKRKSILEALVELERCKGSQFDPLLVQVFQVSLRNDINNRWKSLELVIK